MRIFLLAGVWAMNCLSWLLLGATVVEGHRGWFLAVAGGAMVCTLLLFQFVDVNRPFRHRRGPRAAPLTLPTVSRASDRVEPLPRG